MNPRRRNPALSAFAEKRTRHSVTYVLNVPATTGGIMGSMPRDRWEAGHAHYFVVHKTGNGDGRWGIAGGLGKHGGRYNAMLGRVTYTTPEEAAAALDAYIPKGAGNFIHRSNPAKRNPAEYYYEVTYKDLSRHPVTYSYDTKEEAERKMAIIQGNVKWAKVKMKRVRLNPARRNPDPLACGTGPIPPRVAQAAAAILGWAETERIVGPGLLSGASGYDMRRLVYAAKVERERQGGKPAITRRKRANPRRAARRNPAPTPQMVTADDVWAWSVRLRPATPEVKRLAKAAGMPRTGDRKFWAGEMFNVLMDEHPGDNALANFLDHLERF